MIAQKELTEKERSLAIQYVGLHSARPVENRFARIAEEISAKYSVAFTEFHAISAYTDFILENYIVE